MTVQDTIRAIKKRLRLRMNGDVSASMRAHGMPYTLNFGVDALSLREIGGSYVPDSLLAEALWLESSRECKILATMLYPKTAFDMALAESWLDECFTTELVEQLCFNLLQHLPYANELAKSWSNDPLIDRRSAGYVLTLRLLLSKKVGIVDPETLNKARTDMSDERTPLCIHATRLIERSDGSL